MTAILEPPDKAKSKAAPFVAPDFMVIGEDGYEHFLDAPVNTACFTGAYVHVYYCDDTDEMELIAETGAVAHIDQKRRDEFRRILDDRLACRECMERDATAPFSFDPWWERGVQ